MSIHKGTQFAILTQNSSVDILTFYIFLTHDLMNKYTFHFFSCEKTKTFTRKFTL